MPEFVIEIPHSPEECAAAAAEIERHPEAQEIAAKTYWGCPGGAHTTWIVGEFDGEPEAGRLVPRLLQDTARVVRVKRGGGRRKR